jgi:hypothetical protein
MSFTAAPFLVSGLSTAEPSLAHRHEVPKAEEIFHLVCMTTGLPFTPDIAT